MGSMFTTLMAVFNLWLGVTCVHRPQNVQKVLARFYQSNRPGVPVPGWLEGRALLLFTRLVGFMCLLNFIMLFYFLLHPEAAPQ